MRFSIDTLAVSVLLFSWFASVLSHPQPFPDIQLRTTREQVERDAEVDPNDLWKRKGGGGGGGKGGGGSSSGKGGGSSGSSSSSGYVSSSSSSSRGGGGSSRSGGGVGSSTSSSSQQRGSSSGAAGTKNDPSTAVAGTDAGVGGSASRLWKRPVIIPTIIMLSSGRSGSKGSKPKSNSHSSSSSGKGSSSSNSGGATKTGSGVTPAYGGGRYYGGGATTPYTSGIRSPLGIAPVFLGVGLLSFYPGLWLFGAYNYPYTHPYTFHNRTATNGTNTTTTTRRDTGFEVLIRQTSDEGANQTKPVLCLCAVYAECGCDDNGNTTFLDSIIGDGTYANLNQSLVTVSDVNGTSTIVLNGTLPNGTTAAGGTEDAFSGAVRSSIEMSGYWVMVALVGMTVYLV